MLFTRIKVFDTVFKFFLLNNRNLLKHYLFEVFKYVLGVHFKVLLPETNRNRYIKYSFKRFKYNKIKKKEKYFQAA